jgi:hypothetical protein
MKKVLLVVGLMIISMILMALSQTIQMDFEEIELEFDNVRLRTLEFHDKADIEVNHNASDVSVTKKGNVLSIASDDYSKVSVYLPVSKKYTMKVDDAVCKFDSETVVIETDDEVVTFANGSLTVAEDGENIVQISKDGIIVDDDGEHVEITSEGIVVEGDDNTNLTGFWGQLLGGFVRFVAGNSISWVGKSPARIVKYMVNDQTDDNSFGVNFSWDDDSKDYITKEINKSFEPGKDAKLDVTNINGSIEISSWQNNNVEIDALLRTNKEEDEFDKVEIQIEKEKNWHIETVHQKKNTKVSVRYKIKIPAHLTLEDVVTSNGGIEVTDCNGDMSLRASNGAIEVENVDGMVDAFTSNGSINMEKVSGKVNATTSNGSISMEEVDHFKNLITSNASIEVEMEELNNDVLLSTSNASINLYLNPKLDADIFATTSNSSIDLSGIELNVSRMSKNTLEGTLGKGGYKISASTSNSDVNIYELK